MSHFNLSLSLSGCDSMSLCTFTMQISQRHNDFLTLSLINMQVSVGIYLMRSLLIFFFHFACSCFFFFYQMLLNIQANERETRQIQSLIIFNQMILLRLVQLLNQFRIKFQLFRDRRWSGQFALVQAIYSLLLLLLFMFFFVLCNLFPPFFNFFSNA